MKSYVIHFIRHGLMDGNRTGQYIGSTDVPLAPEGLTQLLELKKRFTYPQADAYFTSPLSRCQQTLKVLYPQAKPLVIPGLAECNFGEWEGKTAAQLQNNPDFIRWMEGSDQCPPGGESSTQFHQRCCEAFEKVVEGLMKTGTTSSVIVTHGGVIMNLLATYGLPRANFYDWLTQSGCGYSVRITPNLWMRGRVMEVYQQLPLGIETLSSGHSAVLDAAREAANRAWGNRSEDSSSS